MAKEKKRRKGRKKSFFARERRGEKKIFPVMTKRHLMMADVDEGLFSGCVDECRCRYV